MELSREDTKMLQGLSLLAMVCLHLFDRWDYEGLYQPLIFLGGVPLSFYLGQLSDFCVMGFAFCSGYAHTAQDDSKENKYIYIQRLKSLLVLLCNYWIILLVFSGVSIIAGQGAWMPGSFGKFIGTALLYKISYNGAWWYMYAYTVLVLISPVIIRLVRQRNTIVVLIAGFTLYFVAYWIRFQANTDSYFLGLFGPFGMTLFEYLMGCVCYKVKFFSRLHDHWKQLNSYVQAIIAAVLFVGMLIGHTRIVPSLFVAPATGLTIMTLFHFWEKPVTVRRFFLLIGRHSTNIWLTHMFFYLVLFKNFVYAAKYPLLIYAFMITITLLVSAALHLIQDPLTRRLRE